MTSGKSSALSPTERIVMLEASLREAIALIRILKERKQ